MKNFRVIVFSVFTLLTVPAAFSAEQITQNVPLPQTSQATAVFHAVVTGQDELVLKPGKVFSEGDDVDSIQLPYLVSHQKSLKYPRWALHQGWQGELVLAVEILPTGVVGRYSIMKSTSYKVLDEAAVSAVQKWKFQPALKNGKPVLTCIQIPVRFKIQE